MPNTNKHILVIRLSAMGDVSIMHPVLDALTKQNPNLKVTVLTQKFLTPIFDNLNNVNVYAAETKTNHKGILGLFKLYKELRNNKFFAIADLHNVLRSNVLKNFFYNTKCIQIDKGRTEKKNLILKKDFKQLKTSAERYADVFRKLGFKVTLDTSNSQKKENLPDNVKFIFEKFENKKTIGIAPFAAHKSKMYSLDKMKVVIDKLSKTYNILLFGGKNDANQLEPLQLNKNIYSVAGKFNFKEELSIISNLDGMLSMDSANAHLAAMYNVKVITLWGVTHPYAGFAPFNQPYEYNILADSYQYPKVPTSIYGNKHPENYINAINSISPNEIITKILKYF